MNVGAYLCYLLTRYDVDCVFGIPGVHTLELYRSLSSASIRHITPRHEQGAGFMADGYARSSGKPGVCFIISGPGMTNIITAMAQAWSDSVPMLVISTVNAHGRMGSGDGWLHELPNQQALINGVCAFSHTVHTAAELPTVMARAFAVFDSARPRPVHIELPINVLASTITWDARSDSITRLSPPAGNHFHVIQAAELLSSATTPLILAGGGCTHAYESVQQLAERLDSPVVMTVNGRGVLPATHPLAVGASASLPPIRSLINSADVVLAMGTELGSTDYDFNEDGLFAIPGKLIQIDIDPQQLMRTRIPDIGLVGDVAGTIYQLQYHLEKPSNRASGSLRARQCLDALNKTLNQRDKQYLTLLEQLTVHLDSPVIVGDSTQIVYAGNSAFAASTPSSFFNSATGFGTLGYALPAAIGAALAVPDRCVVAIAGDGGFQFSLAELATAIDANVSLVLIIHENGGYGEIKKSMEAQNINPVGVDIMVPNIIEIAKACSWQTCQVIALSDLPTLLSDCRSSARPTLLLMPDSVFEP